MKILILRNYKLILLKKYSIINVLNEKPTWKTDAAERKFKTNTLIFKISLKIYVSEKKSQQNTELKESI